MTFDDWLVLARQSFPAMSAANCRVTSPEDEGYNCIAWAAEDADLWWWPDPQGQSYWPPDVPRNVTMDAFKQAFALLGYQHQSDASNEPGVEKVAIFANAAGIPTHAARQLPGGWWASKLGPNIDVEHELAAVEGQDYGTVAVVLARRP